MSSVDKVTDVLIDWYNEAVEMQDVYTDSDMQARAEVLARQIVALVVAR